MNQGERKRHGISSSRRVNVQTVTSFPPHCTTSVEVTAHAYYGNCQHRAYHVSAECLSPGLPRLSRLAARRESAVEVSGLIGIVVQSVRDLKSNNLGLCS